jgi:hypothetical protein
MFGELARCMFIYVLFSSLERMKWRRLERGKKGE